MAVCLWVRKDVLREEEWPLRRTTPVIGASHGIVLDDVHSLIERCHLYILEVLVRN